MKLWNLFGLKLCSTEGEVCWKMSQSFADCECWIKSKRLPVMGSRRIPGLEVSLSTVWELGVKNLRQKWQTQCSRPRKFEVNIHVHLPPFEFRVMVWVCPSCDSTVTVVLIMVPFCTWKPKKALNEKKNNSSIVSLQWQLYASENWPPVLGLYVKVKSGLERPFLLTSTTSSRL